MAGIIRRPSGQYHAQFRDARRDPPVRRVSLGTNRRTEARRQLAQLEQHIKEGTWCPWKGDLQHHRATTLGAAASVFLESRRAAGRREATIRTYTEVLGHFCRHAGDPVRLSDITSETRTRGADDIQLRASGIRALGTTIWPGVCVCRKLTLTYSNVMPQSVAQRVLSQRESNP
jgi:hypothetical protein